MTSLGISEPEIFDSFSFVIVPKMFSVKMSNNSKSTKMENANNSSNKPGITNFDFGIELYAKLRPRHGISMVLWQKYTLDMFSFSRKKIGHLVLRWGLFGNIF